MLFGSLHSAISLGKKEHGVLLYPLFVKKIWYINFVPKSVGRPSVHTNKLLAALNFLKFT